MEMLLHRRMLVLVAGVALALAVVLVLPRASSAAPPEPVDNTFVDEGFCDFPVLREETGHVQFTELPGGTS
jgi:hypothetical protein